MRSVCKIERQKGGKKPMFICICSATLQVPYALGHGMLIDRFKVFERVCISEPSWLHRLLCIRHPPSSLLDEMEIVSCCVEL